MILVAGSGGRDIEESMEYIGSQERLKDRDCCLWRNPDGNGPVV